MKRLREIELNIFGDHLILASVSDRSSGLVGIGVGVVNSCFFGSITVMVVEAVAWILLFLGSLVSLGIFFCFCCN